MLYKAFLSYSHAADGRLAPAVQHALHRIAKPWYRLRTMRVFRDQTNLGTSPGLWTSIESALSQAEYFLYMASPPAAQSPWVQKEVEWWVKNRSQQNFLIVLSDGDLAWDDATRDLDWAVTTALPRQLANVFAEEPLYTDLRWAKSVDQLSPRHSQFRGAILELASTLLNRSKDELDGDDVRQYRRTRRLAWSGVAALAALFVAASLAAYVATRQSQLATSRALGARSEAMLPTNPELAMLLAREAVRIRADDQAEYALRQAFMRNPRRTIHHALPGRNVVAKFVGSDMVVAAEPGKHAVVWRVATGQRTSELSSEVGDQVLLSFSADRSLVVFQTEQNSFALYDAKTWKIARNLPGSNARFSRDGKVLSAVDGNNIRQWNIPSLQERHVAVALPEGYDVRDISADGSLLFLAGNQEVSPVIIVNAESGVTLAKFPKSILRAGTGFSPDDRLLVTESIEGTSFELWDVQTGRRVRALEKPRFGDIGWTTYVAFSRDGKMFVSGNRNGELHAWNVETGEWIGARTVHRNDIGKIEFSPDGRVLLSVAADGTACLWDAASMRCLVTLGGKGDDAWDIGFASDSRQFFTTHVDGTVRVWHRDAWYPALSFPAEIAVASDDGRLVLGAAKNGPVQSWDGETGKLKITVEASAGDIESLALSLPTSLVAIAPAKGVVGLWSAQTGKKILQLGGASANTTALAFNAAGTQLATRSEDGKVRLWSTRDGRLLKEWQWLKDKITDLVVHPDGDKVVLAAWDGRAQVRDVKSSALLLEAKLDEEGAVTQGVTLSTDGKLLMVVGDKFAQVWDIEARKKVRTLAGHSDEIYSGAFSGDGRWLLTGSGYMHARGEPPEDGNEARVWDAKSGRRLLSYRSAGSALRRVSFAKNGVTIFAGSRDGTLRRYECEACLPLSALNSLVSARTSRDLTAEERAQYVPGSAWLGWIVGRPPSR